MFEPSNMSTLERAKWLEMQSDNPQDEILTRLITSLADQSAERIQKVASRIDLDTLKKLTSILSQQISEAKKEKTTSIASELKGSFTEEEILAFIDKLKALKQ